MPTTARFGIALTLALSALACGGGDDPEFVAIEYLRATHNADSDAAVDLLDIDEIVARISSEIAIVNTDGDAQTFLRDSVESLLWGLFQETPREDGLGYDARPADVDGDRATVQVLLYAPDGTEDSRTMHLHRTPAGWKIAGDSVDNLVSYAIQRLQERF